MLWWQTQEYIGDVAEALAHTNEAVSGPGSSPSTRACELGFHALNKLWNALAKHDGDPGLADTTAFIALLNSLPLERQDELLRDRRLVDLVEFRPHVLNHHVLKTEGHRPDQSIKEPLRRKATERHRRFATALRAFLKSGVEGEKTIKRLAEFLYVIRSNIAHGEKTAYGLDEEKMKRDELVSSKALPALELIILLVLDRPDHKLLTYGTLAPREANEAQLAGLEGDWTRCTVRGALDTSEGLSFLRPELNGPLVPARLLRAPALEGHWERLDGFEGSRYRRRLVQADVGGFWEVASAYVRPYLQTHTALSS